MLPILISLGPIKIYSYGVFLAIGLFIGLYFWWKMGRDEHWDEIALFDGFFLSVLTYFVVGRMGYVALHWEEVGTLYRSLALLAYPGINVVSGIVGSAILMILFARNHDWQVWKMADAYVVTLALVLVFGGIGTILNGTNPDWRVNVWGGVFALITFAVVSRVRKDFRFYSWYKGGASMAQEGLASLIFLNLVGVYYLGLREFVPGILLNAVSGYTIYRRIGRRESTIWGKLSNIIRRK
mgnify:FL=1